MKYVIMLYCVQAFYTHAQYDNIWALAFGDKPCPNNK